MEVRRESRWRSVDTVVVGGMDREITRTFVSLSCHEVPLVGGHTFTREQFHEDGKGVLRFGGGKHRGIRGRS